MMKGIIALGLVGLLSSTFAVEKTQCGSTDDRVLSYDRPIGRMLKKTDAFGGCTGTMISKTCVLSAGHCKDYAEVIEFNTEASVDGVIVHPGPESVYFKKDIVGHQKFGAGYDWMVFRVHPNKITGKFAGDAQGTYELSFKVPTVPLDLVLIGYGRDIEPDKNFAQQVGHGELITAKRTVIGHNIDTQGGTSGSVIVERISNKVIGIHTDGGCRVTGNEGTNIGTMLATQKRFRKAIESCLQMEKDDLSK
ncbi:MAG: trypsin-like serine protease [Bacteriovoracaceae bacterium]|nr:trypsin-like serine protease [Bacteriovoracaceae bacterium]